LQEKIVVSREKQKKDSEKEYVFKMPEFDEKEFMETEVRDALALLVIFAYGIFLAALCFFIRDASGNFGIAFLIGLAAIYGFKPLLKVTKFDLSKFTKKNWIVYGFIYIFTWLAFWVVFMNIIV